MADRLLLRNGWIADGTASELQRKDLLIEGNLITQLGQLADVNYDHAVDCSAWIIAPGFIDAHSHSDLQILQNRREKLLQGVTSEVVGNCGFSPYPNSRPDDLHEFGNGILHGQGNWGWPSASEYLLSVHARAKLASVASLVGHGSLRVAHAGLQQEPADDSTISAMESTLDESLAAGAAGFSTGLMYAPGSSASKEELIRLCRVVARRDKIYCSHIRDYSTHLLEAIDEQIELAKAAGCRLQISHLQTVGRSNWKLNSLALEKIESARDTGVDVMFDCYPYVAGSTVLTQLLPQWALQGGINRLSERLLDPATRREIAKETAEKLVHKWTDIFISAVHSARNAGAVGHSVEEISVSRAEDPLECVFNLLIEEHGQVNMLQFNQSEENLRANVIHPLSIIISDGFYVKGLPHPRLHGAFPELLGNVCREKQWLPLPQAIHKVTGAPATRFSIERRGFLQVGYFADLAVFSQEHIRSNATYDNPDSPPVGIVAVFREGKLLLGNDPQLEKLN
jgi:dihydroorotase/N-acyl-D-amino-acid deacylase